MKVRLKKEDSSSTKCSIIIKDVEASILNFLHNLEMTSMGVIQHQKRDNDALKQLVKNITHGDA
jgi:hypothetical protein